MLKNQKQRQIHDFFHDYFNHVYNESTFEYFELKNLFKNERRDRFISRNQTFARQREKSRIQTIIKKSIIIQSIIINFVVVKNDFQISNIEFFYFNMFDIKKNFIIQNKKY